MCESVAVSGLEMREDSCGDEMFQVYERLGEFSGFTRQY